MQPGRRTAVHLCAVIKRICFLGFGVQVCLGTAWMLCHFGCVPAFPRSGSALYRGAEGILGAYPAVLYAVQLGAAFWAGCRFLKVLGRFCGVEKVREKAGSLFLLTYPFALQCHLALLPCSFQSALFLLGLSFLLELPDRVRKEGTGSSGERSAGTAEGKGKISRAGLTGLALACFGLMTVLYQGLEGALLCEYGPEAALASRVAWPTLWSDSGDWPEDLQEIAGSVVWEAGHNPENMEMLCRRIAEEADGDRAGEYYLEMSGHAWRLHGPMVLRQIGWDVLGYTVTPVIVPLQLKGEAYDSFTARNYEIMKENFPRLTKYYVRYGCWEFVCALVPGLCFQAARLAAEGRKAFSRKGKRALQAMLLCAFVSVLLAGALTAQGAGLMDYKNTIAINQLWMAGVFLLMNTANTGSPKGRQNFLANLRKSV